MHIYKNFDIHHDVITHTHTHTHTHTQIKDDLQIKAIKTNKKV